MARDEDRRREGSRVTDNGFRRRVRRFGACVLQERFTPRSVHSTRLHPIYFEETRDEPVHGTRFLPKKHSRTRIATLTTTDGTTFPPPIEVKSTMTRHCFLVLSILALSIAGCVLAVQAETSSLRREFYGPSKPEFLVEYLEGHAARKQRDDQDDPTDDRPRRVRPFARDTQARLSSGSTRYLADDYADESSAASKSIALSPIDRQLLERFVKRNIDEIDRTAFDNFFKRNLDEIDRVGWSGFVKRFADDTITGDGRINVLAQRG
ncbi:uncharacterized protein LOC126917413 isoform X2 [Bombus affinis]|uniref:uncharacterized protein LOC126917413 isoform X2 n=1 Tax=Bombus affinis TaxID=309941 RepID=UPI0021B78768|nr:uncharacterized protein LOC126917413 isoform X2 [Bombus affinis]